VSGDGITLEQLAEYRRRFWDKAPDPIEALRNGKFFSPSDIAAEVIAEMRDEGLWPND
jgi:hypothetical protein